MPVTVVDDELMTAPPAGDVMEIDGGAVSIVREIEAEPVLPALSVTFTEVVCGPSERGVVGVYDQDVVPVGVNALPSIRICALCIPAAEEAVPEIVGVLLLIRALFAGDTIVTTGSVLYTLIEPSPPVGGNLVVLATPVAVMK